ncbi:MAG: transcription-repair coupling factor, partial [bacterium]|nr:transcription-repair coupling factor [bacterium]
DVYKRQRLRTGAHLSISGANVPLVSHLVCALHHSCQRPVLLITTTPDVAEIILRDFHTLCGSRAALFSPRPPDQSDLLSNEPVTIERIETLHGLIQQQLTVIVAPYTALLQELPPPLTFSRHIIHLHVGQLLDPLELLRLLFQHGYERTDLIEFHGECSARGGIVDVFPLTAEYPIRIEFAGNQLCSIREFDVHTQRSRPRTELSSVAIPPARESAVHSDTASSASLLDYFSTPPIIIWHEFRRTLAHLQRLENDPDLSTPAPHLGSRFDAWLSACRALPHLYLQELSPDVPDAVHHVNYHIETAPLDLAAPPAATSNTSSKPHEFAFQRFTQALLRWRADGFSVAIACATDADRDRLHELLTRDAHISPADVFLATAPLSGSWVVPAVRHVTVTDDDIFRRLYSRRRLRRRRIGRVAPIENIATIAPGEFVVHVNHGIGQFEGIRTVDLNGVKREMVIVRYADNALLYVPLEQAHLLERYISVGQGTPPLDSLGSSHWASRTRRAARAVLDLAAELLERQALRASQPGFSFPKDSEWQLSFEKAFPYAETPDQARAILDVKRDMEAPRPMDRLICGDVGFGKTEVALRAAFKAVMAGKQVAVLVPTTLLAQQHAHTFADRLAPFPVRIDVLSRFVSPREQTRILTDLAAGRVDIIIGTHRLLAPEVVFHDLGLIIIDEEHRFGVRHKEALKKIRTLADVVSLSATPIPRTLYAALTGARDMSLINTPPEDRLPVSTHLIKRDYRLIREAILRELARGGQVFFIHNRVESIERTRDLLQHLVPQARVAVAHGQMPEHTLAATMEQFERHCFDVLVSTMIVESGLDLPNVNTIFIDNAHTLGLADLYQLRGRVGRSARQAYAYLIIPADLILDGPARHRLKAILEHTALGSGYAIAMRDLEIRGAGNLLGTQQSGHIAAVGFSLYCRLLQRAVELLQQGKFPALPADANLSAISDHHPPRYDWRKELPLVQARNDLVEFRLPFAGTIPTAYVDSPALRLDLFRRIALASHVSHLQALEAELRDRFGPLPDDTTLLLRLAEARVHALARGIDCIEAVDGKIVFRRRGAIVNPGKRLPRIQGLSPLHAVTVILAHLVQLPPLSR